MKKPRVFVTGSLWSLLIYLIISEEDDIKRTHYFFSRGIDESVRKNFKYTFMNMTKLEKYRLRYRLIIYALAPIYYRIRFPYLMFSDIYGIDQGWNSKVIIGRSKYTLIEDGVIDYQIERGRKKGKFDFLRKLIWGAVYRHEFGDNSQCKHIIFTQSFSNPMLQKKAKTYDMIKLWTSSSASKQELILSKLNLTQDDIKRISQRPIILLTQPLSEDGMMSEHEKIQLYMNIISPYGAENVLIKPHPREKTDYAKHIPLTCVFEKVVPFQIFSLLGVHFSHVVTICSTAALFLKSPNTVIDFKGSAFDSRIAQRYGIITINSYK